MLNRLRGLWRDTKGVSAIEFGLLLPVLMTMFIGMTEVTFMLWATQKAEKLAVTLADVVAQSQGVTQCDLKKLTGSVDKIMDPFPFITRGKVIISSVYRAQEETDPKVNWQYSPPTSGGPTNASKLGAKGANATLPDGFTLAERDNVIVAEVYYRYEPIMPGLMFDETTYYRRAMFKPRLGALTTEPSNTPSC
jgi:Flp pilus assembly protein TadG